MHSFLRNTAQQLLEKHVNLQHITLVLPNRRAGLFFTQHLGTLIAEPMWMPEVKTIEDLFYQYAGQRPADDLTLILSYTVCTRASIPHLRSLTNSFSGAK